MRRILFPLLLLGLVAGCSVPRIGPHRIDVQQGNALDQENVARLKTGLNRAQVRFLLGTPLVVDPFRTDRWDYVYLYYKSGQLTEQKRITLFFEGDTLARIEGDLPEATPAASATVAPKAAEPVRPAITETPQVQAPVAAVAAAALAVPAPAVDKPAVRETMVAEKTPEAPIPARVASTRPAPAASPAAQPASSVVPPLPSPPNAPAYVDPRVQAEPAPGMVVETDVERIRPDVIPPFPDTQQTSLGDDDVLKAVDGWAKAWAARDESAYLAAYDADFVPVGDASREDWEKRRKLLLGMSKNIDLRVDSPSVERNDDGSATVTFNQFYRSDSYRDAVVKQLRLVPREGRWLIVQEKVLSILRGARS